MTITKKFDINSIEDYQLAIKLNASVFIREPDNDLIENFQDFLKTHSLIPSIEYDENGYNLYLGTLMNRHDYRPEHFFNSKAEMEIYYNIDYIEGYIKVLNDNLATLKSDTDDDTKINALSKIRSTAIILDALFMSA